MITVSPQGENSIVVTPGANAEVTADFIDAHRETIRDAGIVLAQLEIPIDTVEHLASLCGAEGIPLMLDPAPAHALPLAIFRHVQWFTPNETEAAFFAAKVGEDVGELKPEKTANALLAAGAESVVLKMGSRGVYLSSANGLSQMIPAFRVTAVDTTAAGDAFNGAFATALMLGFEQQVGARFAAAAAAISVTRPGAQPSMPTRAEVDELLRAHGS